MPVKDYMMKFADGAPVRKAAGEGVPSSVRSYAERKVDKGMATGKLAKAPCPSQRTKRNKRTEQEENNGDG